ncbi:hypothetical protein [Pedomonas mirosovicensis]|uniref:hypothetical protein n=1 Tax=Pedomonas mirosovicensis TaxID=2908641 RepID=UPI0021697458|nr:hypothetical protein [Pedomonas mirosovicensis]MCH8683772.1 hypothetical protein [Pedomonas mirosovicensis]
MPATNPSRFRSMLPEIGIALILSVLLVAMWELPVSHDVVWQLWIARQMIHGTQLYAEINEVNPPLWFWAALPVQGLAEALHLPARSILIATTLGLISLALALLSRLCAEEGPWRRAGVLFAALLAMVLIPIHEFAQREHLALIGALPYAMLAARRAEGKAIPLWVAVLTGLLAAYGFALKHYFLLIPIALEAWLALFHRAHWRLLRPETLVLALCGLAYGAAIFAFAPAFLDVQLPMVAAAYDGYKRPFITVLLRTWTILWALGLIGATNLPRPLHPRVMAGLLTSLCFIFSYFIQMKGWAYHAISASGALFFTLGIAVLLQPLSWRWMVRHPSLPAMLLLLGALSANTGPYHNSTEAETRALLARARPGDPVAILTVRSMRAWPLVEDARLVWPLRLYSYWMLPAMANTPEAEKTPQLKALEEEIIRQTREDLLCLPPRFIVADDSSKTQYMHSRFDIIGFMKRDAAFRAFIGHYRPVRTSGPLTLWERVGDIPPVRTPKCRTIS